tara:strand:- start:49 stop:309 length:261 start_codon:yes stop_codon:yes gene_type:complete
MKKIYRLTALNCVIEMLRPGAKYEISSSEQGLVFTRWDDDRPKPLIKEVLEVQRLSKEYEDKINTIWREEDIKKHNDSWTSKLDTT